MKHFLFVFAAMALFTTACDNKNETGARPILPAASGAPTPAPNLDPLSAPATVDAKTGKISDATGWDTAAVGKEIWLVRLVTLDKGIVDELQKRDKDFNPKENLIQFLRQVALGPDNKPLAAEQQKPGSVEFLDVPASEPVIEGKKDPRFTLSYTVPSGAPANQPKYDYPLVFKDDKGVATPVGTLTLTQKPAADPTGKASYEPTVSSLCPEPGPGLKPVCEVTLAAGKFDQLVLKPENIKANQAAAAAKVETDKDDLQKAQAKVTEANAQLKAAEEKMAQVATALDSASKAKTADSAKIKDLSTKNATLQTQLDESKKAAQVQLDETKKALQAQLDEAKKNLEEANKKASTAEQQLAKEKAKLKAAEEALKKVQVDLNEAKKDVKPDDVKPQKKDEAKPAEEKPAEKPATT